MIDCYIADPHIRRKTSRMAGKKKVKKNVGTRGCGKRLKEEQEVKLEENINETEEINMTDGSSAISTASHQQVAVMELKISREIDEENNSDLAIVQSDVNQHLDKIANVKLDDKISKNSDTKTEYLEAVAKVGKIEVTSGEPPEGEVDRLLAALRSLCTDSNTDTVLRCRGQQLRCHSALLRARSPVLAQLLEEVKELDLDLEPGAVQAVMTFMYHGRLSRLPQAARLGQVVEVAARLGVTGVARSCALLLDGVEIEEAVEVLVVAETLGLEEVVRAAVGRVLKDGGRVARDPCLRDLVLEHPEALLRLYEALWKEEEGLGEVRVCYGCGASITGICCVWCSTSHIQ